MRLFLDTANLEEIREAAALGVISGVTTNPTLMARESGSDFERTIEEICSLIPGPISAEVTTLDAEAMITQGKQISAWADNVVVKLPICRAGLQAAKALVSDAVRVNMTLCFTVNQALLAAAVGAAFVSPFVGRLDDVSQDGMQLVADIVDVYDRYGIATEVIAASIRHPQHVVAAAQAGAHIATLPYKVLLQMLDHPLTTVGIEKFAADWARSSARGAGPASRAALA